MKFTKMSLVAALLVGSSAFALDNVKMSGDAKVFYSTDDTTDLFDKSNAYAQTAASLSLSADLVEGVSAGAKVTALSTLGLQGQLVGNVWEGTNGVTDTFITNELWMAASMGKTTVKVGRMPLDTPLVFTETWSIVENTFEAAVIINQDIPDTTLVGAYVGGSNGSHNSNANGTTLGINNIVDGIANGSTFTQFWNGAYAAGVINNSFEPVVAQAWYFDATGTTQAYWLQADLAMEGILAGVQYTSIDDVTVGGAVARPSGTAYAVMLGYEMKDMFTAKLSYSDTTDAGAGYNLSGSSDPQSKLYTEAWWKYASNTRAETSTYNVTIEAPVADIADFGLYYMNADQSKDAGNIDVTDLTLTASKSFGPLDTTLAYTNYKVGTADAVNQVQAYLTLNF